MEKLRTKLSPRVLLTLILAFALVITMTVSVAAESPDDSLADVTETPASDTAEPEVTEPLETVPFETDASGNYILNEGSTGFRIQDVLLVPMGFVIRVCYNVTHNYAVSLLLFAVVMQLILFPLGIKQQKNMNKQASLRPKESAIRKKYAGRTDAVTQKKMNDEIMALYQQENFNPASGCLPLLIQLPIIFALFAVVREPLTYITRLPSDVITVLQTQVSNAGAALTRGYEQIGIISYLKENGLAAISGLGDHVTSATIESMPNFRIFGGAFDLSVMPSSNLWSLYLLVPVLTFVFMYGSMKLTRKFSYQPQTTGDAQTQSSMKIMELLSPAMCTYFAFIVPSAIGIYWMYRNILAVIQQFVLSKMYPTPKFTEEELKEAEREYLGKGKRTKTERDPNKPKPRSLHRIDFDDEDDEPSKPQITDGGKKSSPIEAAPLKDDKPNKKDSSEE